MLMWGKLFFSMERWQTLFTLPWNYTVEKSQTLFTLACSPVVATTLFSWTYCPAVDTFYKWKCTMEKSQTVSTYSRFMSRTMSKDVSLELYNLKSMDNKLMAFPSSSGSTFTFVWHLTLLCRKSTVEAHQLQRISPRKRNQVMPQN